MKINFLIFLSILTLSGCKTLSGDADLAVTPEQRLAKSELEANNQAEIARLQAERELLSSECAAEHSPIDLEVYDNVWQRILLQLSLELPDNKRVRAQKNWYLSHPGYMKRVTERASPYLFYIVESLEKNQLPLELALLPIVESAFDPFAYSHGRASGMWQFIPSTGKNFGLKQNWWYDGRRDVDASTRAAVKFLSYLYKRFDGDWLHALAAYNSGEGNVRKAIRINRRKGKPTDFWSLKLPKETKAYVPKLLALADILKSTQADHAIWTPVPNLPYFDRVTTESQIDLSLAAALAEISMDKFYQLNPAFNQWATSPSGRNPILLPIEKIDTFKQNLVKIPKNQRISYKKYTIQPGDSLIKIARRFSTTVDLLKTNNPITNNTIRAGKTLLIPVASKARDQYHKSAQQRLNASQNTRRKGRKQIVRVTQGDSMWELSRRYKVNMRSLAKWNNMAPTDPLRVGQKLVVWTKQPLRLAGLSSAKQKTKKIHYKVRRGDSLARIADKFKVSLNSVKKWNRQKGQQKYLQPGDSLTLYVDITRQF